ncbi:hypothetical protein GCM10011519_22250 [Marmoricola endophyticus]|uniref:PH domain-containing protein n=1 Tax=Marmoricola endophyticus TaxID=2040280 RepID=A0A917BKP8_9ACTN|nr:hypothetical protein [Marmoricola endophyticus]GGF47745.1 hypothetical protein GCM10011519_22250 [Marmoricola endophyticus]
MTATPPRRLVAAADQARLGRLEAVDQGPPPLHRAAWTFVGVVVAIAFAIVLATLVRTQGAPDALRLVALLALFVTFVPFGRALRGVVVGAPTTCVHERGVVVGDKRSAVTLAWRDIASVERLRTTNHGSALVGWALHGKDERRYRVLLLGHAPERAALATALERTAADAGVALTDQE